MKIGKIKNKTILFISLALGLILLITGIILMAVEAPEYQNFIKETIDGKKDALHSEIFVYGVFSLVLGILLAILSAFIANDVFNKKLRQQN